MELDINKISEKIMRESNFNNNDCLNLNEVSKIIDKVQQDNIKDLDKETKRKGRIKDKKPKKVKTLNKGSFWLNIIAFFIPIWGIFCIFFDLYKYPKRSCSVFISTFLGLVIQITIILFVYFQLYDLIEYYFVLWFG